MQFAKKLHGSNVWSRVGEPVASGYINLHNSYYKTNKSSTIECMIDFNAGDEVALFTAGIGEWPGDIYALPKLSSLSIHSFPPGPKGDTGDTGRCMQGDLELELRRGHG